jgi:hypothetical protein
MFYPFNSVGMSLGAPVGPKKGGWVSVKGFTGLAYMRASGLGDPLAIRCAFSLFFAFTLLCEPFQCFCMPLKVPPCGRGHAATLEPGYL